ncbi:hypothetical protein [Actinoplanes sp. NPDC026619]|uniref:hypothetical protein n=1 Tax=Actinoplanes sp. NPDC026619 TaxID=3155798 RepID=UPI0033F56F75
MPTNRKVLFGIAILLGFLTAGCGAGSDDSSSGGDTFQQNLAYAKCLRANGLPTFPDPEQVGGGTKVGGGELLDTPAGKKAAEACRDKQPQDDGDAAGGDGLDQSKVSAWMKCMRAALAKFPGGQVTGSTITINLAGTGIKGDSTEFETARKSCESDFPGGSLKVVDQ